MVVPAIKEAIERQLEKLPLELQRRVLDFTNALVLSQPHGISGKQVLSFAGAMSAADTQAIEEAIAEGCETVNRDEW